MGSAKECPYHSDPQHGNFYRMSRRIQNS